MRSISSRLSLVAAVLSLATLWSGVGVAEAHHQRSGKPRHHVRAHKSDVEEDIIEVETIEQVVEGAEDTELEN